MAWPSVTESVFTSLTGMIDTYMVAGLGKSAVAAIGVTNQPKYFIFTLFFAMNVAISTLVARRVGEKRQKDANGLFMTGLVFIIAASLIISVLCLVTAEPFMRLCGANAETIGQSVTYFRIVLGFSIFQLVSMYINAAQRGSGNTKIAMMTVGASNIIHIILNLFLIQGRLGFPKLGVAGAAISVVIGTVAACVMSIQSLFRKDSFIQAQYILREKIKPAKEYAKELAPVTGTFVSENILTRLGMMVTSAMTARIGTSAFAAHLVGMNFMNLGFAFGDGLQSASIALVGRSLGEKDVDKAKEYAWNSQSFGFAISAVVSILMLLLNQQIFALYFPNDPQMLVYGRTISYFFAIIMPIQVSKIVFNGALRGAGDIRYTLIGSTIGVTLVQPVVLYVLTQMNHMGLAGVWISILVSQAVQWVLFGGRFLSGKWVKHALKD